MWGSFDVSIYSQTPLFHAPIIVMKLILVIGLLLGCVASLYTSKHFEKKGFNVKDGVYDQVKVLDVRTVCNDVILNVDPYRYNGTVKSGYLNVGSEKGASALAFIFYGREGTPKNELKNYPLIIWLNGGPGSSSQLGNLMELGPLWIKESSDKPFDIVRNQYAWTNEYNVLFVDQPVGTGLSYADPRVQDPYVHSMDDVAKDFYAALDAMYNEGAGCFKDLGITGDKDLFIFGESYAGKYVPAIAGKILSQKAKGGFLTGLRGAAIGDGFTHPYQILAEVGAFSYNVGLLDFQERSKIEQLIINATFQERNRQWDELHLTFDKVLDNIVEWAGGVNVYDFTKYKDYPTQLLEEYFWNPSVKALYKLNSDIEYNQQGGNVYQALFTDFMKPEVARVQYLLSQDLPVLIYNGQNDIIVENPGTMRWVQQIFYANSSQFRDTLFSVWKVDGKVAGSQKKVGKLDFRIVNNAGHLVPMDQGYNSLAMVREFVNANKKSN